jgi:hypothetical protein
MITLKTLAAASEQEVFDQVAAHLIRQGKASVGDDGRGRYRGNEGLKCAGGCLIADEEYDETMDDRTSIEGSNDTGWGHLARIGVFPKAHMTLIRELQYIHDNIDTKSWKKTLKALACDMLLKFNH